MSTSVEAAGALQLLCGDLIGSGMSRKVYDCAILPGHVVKVEGEGWYQNVLEWHLWNRVNMTPFAKWFAPCLHISNNASILIMKRTVPALPSELPDKLPAFFTDIKPSNFGFVEDNGKRRFVCHDYGSTLVVEKGLTKSLRKAHWD